MAGEVIVDALPYIDHDYDEPGVREAALAMVEEECRRYRPTKNYLDHLPPLNTTAFETKMIKTEFERIQNHTPMESLSMKRYELPPPSAARLSDYSAWQEAVENSMAQLEHQATRVMNLELMLEYGCESWKAYLELFTALQAKAQNQLQEVKKMIQDINWQRKSTQTQVGEKLKELEAHWVMLVSKNYEIEQECDNLEKHIEELKSSASKDVEENSQPTQNDHMNGFEAEDEE
ncbi:BCAS2 family protein [Megaselia abdita]